jgi:tRNA (guanine37-N1)-methyltransferase
MKKFEIITIFPKIFDSYFNESIIKRAQKEKYIAIKTHDLRDWTSDKHRKVDDTPYGGGAGMVLKVQPIHDAVAEIKSRFPDSSTRVILFSAKGKRYTQKDARRLSKYDRLIMICGRYEGVDERVAKYVADEEISIGEYVLTGGEIPAMVVVDSISRLIPGVLGNNDSLKDESFNKIGNLPAGRQGSDLEYSQYTKPDDFQGWKVPKILLSGDHGKIREWRAKSSKITK